MNFNNADYSNLHFSDEDKTILKKLAKQVLEIANRPIMEENKRLWIKHNKLEGIKPIILCDPENGWNEIILEKDIKCKNDIAKHCMVLVCRIDR